MYLIVHVVELFIYQYFFRQWKFDDDRFKSFRQKWKNLNDEIARIDRRFDWIEFKHFDFFRILAVCLCFLMKMFIANISFQNDRETCDFTLFLFYWSVKIVFKFFSLWLLHFLSSFSRWFFRSLHKFKVIFRPSSATSSFKSCFFWFFFVYKLSYIYVYIRLDYQ